MVQSVQSVQSAVQLFQCDHAAPDCGDCPHAKPHEKHGPRQTMSDGDKSCDQREYCDGIVEGIGEWVRCRVVI